MPHEMEDRERNLWIASQRYIDGEIDVNEFEKEEEYQAEMLRNAILSLSKQSVRSYWPLFFKSLFQRSSS